MENINYQVANESDIDDLVSLLSDLFTIEKTLAQIYLNKEKG